MHVVSTDTECGEGEGPDLMKVRENGATGGHAASNDLVRWPHWERRREREEKMGRLSLKPSYIVLTSSLRILFVWFIK